MGDSTQEVTSLIISVTNIVISICAVLLTAIGVWFSASAAQSGFMLQICKDAPILSLDFSTDGRTRGYRKVTITLVNDGASATRIGRMFLMKRKVLQQILALRRRPGATWCRWPRHRLTDDEILEREIAKRDTDETNTDLYNLFIKSDPKFEDRRERYSQELETGRLIASSKFVSSFASLRGLSQEVLAEFTVPIQDDCICPSLNGQAPVFYWDFLSFVLDHVLIVESATPVLKGNRIAQVWQFSKLPLDGKIFTIPGTCYRPDVL